MSNELHKDGPRLRGAEPHRIGRPGGAQLDVTRSVLYAPTFQPCLGLSIHQHEIAHAEALQQ